jgi:hypothetical protein
MGRRNYAPRFREQIEKGEVRRNAAAAVQIKERRALAALDQLEVDACYRGHCVFRW